MASQKQRKATTVASDDTTVKKATKVAGDKVTFSAHSPRVFVRPSNSSCPQGLVDLALLSSVLPMMAGGDSVLPFIYGNKGGGQITRSLA